MRAAEPELQNYWNWKAAGNFIAGGAGSGLLFFTAVTAQQNSAWLSRAGFAALALIAAGLVCVFLELGRPLRSLNVIFRPQTSWMSREALVAGPMFAAGAAAVLFNLPGLALIAGVLALALLYCHARLLNAAKGIPAWREPATVPLIFVTGLTEGAAVFVLIAAAFGSVPLSVIATLAILVVARLLVWRTYRTRILVPGAAPIKTVEALNPIHQQLTIVGHVSPLALLMIAAVAPVVGTPLAAVGSLLALAAGWHLKYMLITRASYNQGFAISRSPARTPGFSRAGTRPGWT
jgi:phenylacetyl-CoA:acceptor oxidoreductase 26-kDa subunit